MAAAINAVDPREAIRRMVLPKGDSLEIAGGHYRLSDFRRVLLLSVGKAARGMAAEMDSILGDWLETGLVVTKHGDNADPPDARRLTVLQASHPVPDADSLLAGQQALRLAASLTPDDLLFCLISGGASALMTVPVPGVDLADMRSLTSSLLACGAAIDEINILRRVLDQVKGGGIARAANGARVVSLIISDVIGDRLEAIGSGPTVPDPTTALDALAVLEKYHLEQTCPAGILASLHTGPPERRRKREPAAADHFVIASNLRAAQAALRQAEQEGFQPYLLRTDLQGEAREAGLNLAGELRWAAQHHEPVVPPACLLAGGETTVTLSGNGRGGRNTELALAASIALASFPGVMLVSLATDGEDGPTDAAGAVVTGESWAAARYLGLDPSDFLRRNDSYSFFDALGDLLRPGVTGTNVNDLSFLFAF